MFAVRSFVSVSSLLLATVATTGCYDLSAPSGPRRDSFVRDKSPTETQEQGQTATEPTDESDSAEAVEADSAEAVPPEKRLRSQLRIVPDEAR